MFIEGTSLLDVKQGETRQGLRNRGDIAKVSDLEVYECSR